MPDEAYRVKYTDQYFDALDGLMEGHLNRVTAFVSNHVQHTPTLKVKDLKELHGDQAGIWQYMVSYGENIRLLYRIDEEERVVYLEYLGTHPKWNRVRRGQNFAS